MTGMPARKQGWTWADIRDRPEGERWEIVAGEPFDMSPSPTSRHQFVVAELARQLANFFHGKRCCLWLAPMPVKLSEEDVVQPDLFVVCDPRQVKPTHIEGPPRLVIEVLSETTLRHDRVRKYRLYEAAGVREYWLITPHPSLVEVYQLKAGRYLLHGGYEKHEQPRSPTLLGLRLDLGDVFAFPLEPGEQIQMVQEAVPPYRTRRARRV